MGTLTSILILLAIFYLVRKFIGLILRMIFWTAATMGIIYLVYSYVIVK